MAEEDIEFQAILSQFNRQFNLLKEASLPQRKAAIEKVHELLEDWKVDLDFEEMEKLHQLCSKNLLQCFSDDSQRVRELSIQIYKTLISR